MPFEKFERKRSAIRTIKPMASIWRRGQINFNKAAVDTFKLASKNRVALYYDADTNRIGFDFMETDENVPGTLSVKVRQSGILLACKSFLEYFDLLREKTVRYELSHDLDNDLLIIQLGCEMGEEDKYDDDDDDDDDYDDSEKEDEVPTLGNF